MSQYDSDQDGIVDNPDAFNHVVDPETNPLTKYVFQKLVSGSAGTTRYDYVDAATEKIYVRQSSVGTIGDYTDGDIVYLVDSDSFKQINTTTNTTSDVTNYIAHCGRDKIKFQYVHTVDGNTRLDPSASNLLDMYILTRTYDTDYRLWLDGTNETKPLLPSRDSLFTNFNSALAPIKSISDTIIYHPVKYKVLFGSNADTNLQATFKVVNDSDGTGKNANSDFGEVYGKTGTAQNPHGDDHSWFSGFIDLPTGDIMSLVVIVENGGKGSQTSAYIAKELFDEYAKLKK